jgi:hypothetical protein
MTIDFRCKALLSVQRAFLGEISVSIRGISVDTSNEKVVVTIYVDGLVSEDFRDELSCVETEVLADFPNNLVRFEISEGSRKGSRISPKGDLIFLRKEN